MAIKLLNSDAYSKCYTKKQITSANGSVVNNADGTVTVFIPNNVGVLTPVPLGKLCCEALDKSYTFDINTQTCRWGKSSTCDFSSPINVNIFSNGDDGSLFLVDNDEKCDLKVSFDYIFKIKCESLNKILFPTTTANPATLKKMNDLNNQSSEVSVKVESLENQVLLLDEQIKATLYSINCDSFPYSNVVVIGPEVPTPIEETPKATVKGNFGKSGFGNLSPMSMAKVKYYSVNFCLTEPSGLSVWANILGELRYRQFLDGDPTSYTCDDVINIYNQNTNDDLIMICDTPFGAKTQLIKQQKVLIDELYNSRNTLTDLNLKSSNVQSTLSNTIAGCTTPIQALETLNISMGVDVINADNTIENVFTETLLDIGVGNLYSYLTNLPASNNNNSGLYICGDPTINEVDLSPCTVLSLNNGSFTPNVSSCTSIIQPLLNSLLSESQLTPTEFNTHIASNVFASGWVHYESLRTDPLELALMANKKIKLTLTINDTCVDVCVLLDNIVLDKSCTITDTQTIEISQSPGFDLSRVQDNKKSWVSKDTPTNREFLIAKSNGTSPIRQTDYDVNDERLVVNTKEIDLDINIAGAIENDVWCYLVDNPCLLTGITTCNPCEAECGNKQFQDDECFNFQDDFIYEFQDGVLDNLAMGTQECCGDNKIDFSNLLTSPLSAVTTIEGFENLLVSELIDVKNRKTISGYPTLRALYDRYMHSSNYCATNSSHFDYNTMDTFSNLVGNYWVDIIEQVIPATTIWGSVKIYSNTIFDEQKFRYRQYSTLICTNPFYGFNLPSPINGTTGNTHSIEIHSETIELQSSESVKPLKKPGRPCHLIHNVQMNSGSEFIGGVTIIGQPINPSTGCDENSNFIGECNIIPDINVDIRSTDNILITVSASNGLAPYTYLWNTNETTTTINGQGGTTYSCEITDSNCCKKDVSITIPELSACVYTLPETPEYLMGSLYFNLFGTSPSCDPGSDPLTNSKMSIYDVTVNGSSLLTTTVSTDVNQVSVDWLQANNNLVYQCTLGQVTGQTYTNFVDLMNTVFDDLDLTYYKAQIAKIPRDVYDIYGYTEPLNGFYIIRPSSDTFSIKADANTNVDKYYYTQDGVNDWDSNNGWSFQYPKFTCTGITLNNSIVVE